ncbi:SMI1/KNR4 family protein [Rapidithrix thailandica]|uniref:SMI1/KNR4 family protein n=1 Tax=Rapidithrix thailandica TaxID=413964 RepID=A0AAW9RQR7_9BACT
MNLQKIPYNSQLKKLAFENFEFATIPLESFPAPYYKDYSQHPDPAYRNYKSYDTFGFRDLLLNELSEVLGSEVLKLIIITPKTDSVPYEAFAFLKSKDIVALHFNKSGSFQKWMDIVFENQFEGLAEDRRKGLFERQPELNLNPQFMVTFGKGEFSQKTVNSGMLIDERPYEKTGEYLYKRVPKKYNEAKIAKEKQKYIEKYLNTMGARLEPENLKKTFQNFLSKLGLQVISPRQNEAVYKEFENLSEFPFPDDLQVLFELHNGIHKTGFLTAEQVLQEWKNWKVIYDDWVQEELTGNNYPDGRKTIGMYTNPYWVPFLSTAGGNFAAIDYAPGSKGKSGQIIAFGPDEDKIRWLAENMEDFLQQCIDGKDVLNNGFD